MPSSRISKVYTISLPPELAEKAEDLARRDSRTMSELFREAFRAYYGQQARSALAEIGDYAESRNPRGYSEADIPRLIKEVRAKKKAATKNRSRP
jgi:predicted DNA-binding protein